MIRHCIPEPLANRCSCGGLQDIKSGNVLLGRNYIAKVIRAPALPAVQLSTLCISLIFASLFDEPDV